MRQQLEEIRKANHAKFNKEKSKEKQELLTKYNGYVARTLNLLDTLPNRNPDLFTKLLNDVKLLLPDDYDPSLSFIYSLYKLLSEIQKAHKNNCTQNQPVNHFIELINFSKHYLNNLTKCNLLISKDDKEQQNTTFVNTSQLTNIDSLIDLYIQLNEDNKSQIDNENKSIRQSIEEDIQTKKTLQQAIENIKENPEQPASERYTEYEKQRVYVEPSQDCMSYDGYRCNKDCLHEGGWTYRDVSVTRFRMIRVLSETQKASIKELQKETQKLNASIEERIKLLADTNRILIELIYLIIDKIKIKNGILNCTLLTDNFNQLIRLYRLIPQDEIIYIVLQFIPEQLSLTFLDALYDSLNDPEEKERLVYSFLGSANTSTNKLYAALFILSKGYLSNPQEQPENTNKFMDMLSKLLAKQLSQLQKLDITSLNLIALLFVHSLADEHAKLFIFELLDSNLQLEYKIQFLIKYAKLFDLLPKAGEKTKTELVSDSPFAKELDLHFSDKTNLYTFLMFLSSDPTKCVPGFKINSNSIAELNDEIAQAKGSVKIINSEIQKIKNINMDVWQIKRNISNAIDILSDNPIILKTFVGLLSKGNFNPPTKETIKKELLEYVDTINSQATSLLEKRGLVTLSNVAVKNIKSEVTRYITKNKNRSIHNNKLSLLKQALANSFIDKLNYSTQRDYVSNKVKIMQVLNLAVEELAQTNNTKFKIDLKKDYTPLFKLMMDILSNHDIKAINWDTIKNIYGAEIPADVNELFQALYEKYKDILDRGSDKTCGKKYYFWSSSLGNTTKIISKIIDEDLSRELIGIKALDLEGARPDVEMVLTKIERLIIQFKKSSFFNQDQKTRDAFTLEQLIKDLKDKSLLDSYEIIIRCRIKLGTSNARQILDDLLQKLDRPELRELREYAKKLERAKVTKEAAKIHLFLNDLMDKDLDKVVAKFRATNLNDFLPNTKRRFADAYHNIQMVINNTPKTNQHFKYLKCA